MTEEELKQEIEEQNLFLDPSSAYPGLPYGKYYSEDYTEPHEPLYPIESYNFSVRAKDVAGYDKDYSISQPVVAQYLFYEETTEDNKPYFLTQVFFPKINENVYEIAREWAKDFASEEFTPVNDLANVKERSAGDLIIEIGEYKEPGFDHYVVFIRFFDNRIPYYAQ